MWWTMASERLRQAGASRLASASSVPLRPERDSTTFVDLVGRPDIPPEKRLNARRRLVSPDFFAVMGMPVLAGRTFTAADDPSAPGVAIVNETFVRRSLGDADPLRERMKGLLFRRVNGKFVEQEVAIVGVVGDAHYASVTEPPEPIVYLPRTQFQSERELFVIDEADGTPERHIAEFRAAIRDFDPKLAIEFGTMSGFVTASLERPRLGMWLMTAFGIAGLVLATVGVFGVVAYVVSQRRGELAVRQALGASRIGVVWMVVRDSAGALAARHCRRPVDRAVDGRSRRALRLRRQGAGRHRPGRQRRHRRSGRRRRDGAPASRATQLDSRGDCESSNAISRRRAASAGTSCRSRVLRPIDVRSSRRPPPMLLPADDDPPLTDDCCESSDGSQSPVA